MTELKPCPFCGGKASISEQWQYYQGDCLLDHVGCCVTFEGGDVEESDREERTAEAVEAWNTRAANCPPKDSADD